MFRKQEISNHRAKAKVEKAWHFMISTFHWSLNLQTQICHNFQAWDCSKLDSKSIIRWLETRCGLHLKESNLTYTQTEIDFIQTKWPKICLTNIDCIFLDKFIGLINWRAKQTDLTRNEMITLPRNREQCFKFWEGNSEKKRNWDYSNAELKHHQPNCAHIIYGES